MCSHCLLQGNHILVIPTRAPHSLKTCLASLRQCMHDKVQIENVAVVLPFNIVYTLELNRRENDKKIIALYVEMKDMMGRCTSSKMW
ncbi:hypothetical protein BJV77DRAFT_318662 [Russula vinacea]|nr:hypothetical protein BJV77DRAFT_318662 [Russula vinacea]